MGDRGRAGASAFSLRDVVRGGPGVFTDTTEDLGAGVTITMDPGWILGQMKRGGRDTEPHGPKQETERPTEAALGQVQPVHYNSFSSLFFLGLCLSLSTGTSQQHPFCLVRQVSPENLPLPRHPDVSKATMNTRACFLSGPVRACLLFKCEPTLYRVGSIL